MLHSRINIRSRGSFRWLQEKWVNRMLCGKCRAILRGNGTDLAGYSILSYDADQSARDIVLQSVIQSFDLLEKEAESGCPLCALFLSTLSGKDRYEMRQQKERCSRPNNNIPRFATDYLVLLRKDGKRLIMNQWTEGNRIGSKSLRLIKTNGLANELILTQK